MATKKEQAIAEAMREHLRNAYHEAKPHGSAFVFNDNDPASVSLDGEVNLIELATVAIETAAKFCHYCDYPHPNPKRADFCQCMNDE